MCYKQDRLIFQAYLQHQEKQYEKKYKCELSLNDDYQEGSGSLKRSNLKVGIKAKQKGGDSKAQKELFPTFDTLEKRKQAEAYLFHHEFLYLVCNSQVRIDQIINNHKMNLVSDLYYINQWELDKTCYQQEGNAMTHIHLLATDFRDDKRPTKLVSNALDTMADTTKPWKYTGANMEKKAKHTDYNLRDMFNKGLQEKVNRYKKHGERFEYTEGFSAEV